MAGYQKIFLVEDDAMIREMYHTAFEGAGYNIQDANDANEAFTKLKSFTPDLLFLDIMLPGASGVDILKELRRNPDYKCQNAKIFLLTNLAQDNLAQESMNNKADGYIIKADTVPGDLIDLVQSLSEKSTNDTPGSQSQI